MRFLKEGDKGAVKATDASVTNIWSWKWPDEPLQHSFDKIGPVKYTLGECIRKIDVAGIAWCLWCEDKISYGSNGKKHLVNHCSTDKHLDILKVRVTNYQIGGVGPSSLDAGADQSMKVEKSLVFSPYSRKPVHVQQLVQGVKLVLNL